MTSQSVVVPNVAPSAVVPTAVVQTAVATTQPGQHPMASLYVGDLHPTATEAMLYTKFSEVGPVLSIRVCRDAITRRSLGYAYVNFQQSADAERAITNMNFDQLNGKPIRIMWSQRDPTVRRSNNGNIFIKNLDQSIDTKSIYDTFSMFGKILSCKVACDDEGKSKGYGFIHFEHEEDALKAIEKVDGMLLDQKPVTVCKFQPRVVRLREMGDAAHRFTNVYVKNFADHLKDDDALKKLFDKFGTITNAVVIKDADGKSRGFGFVCFEGHDGALKAVEEMNGRVLPGTDLELTVCRAQKKSERQAELARIYEQYKTECLQKYRGTNLYVKNLDDTIDDAELKRNFEQYGKINSAKVMVDPNNGCSKGFGFVGYESADDASRALAEMNSKILKSKPLYVALAQRKEERRAQLAQQYMQRVANMRQNQAGGIPRYNTGMANAGFSMPDYAAVQPHQNYIGRPPMMQNYPQIPQNPHMGQRRQQNNYNYGFGRGTGANRSFMPNHGGPRRPSFNQIKMAPGGRSSRYGSIQQTNVAAPTNPQEQKQAIGEQLYKLIGNMTNDPNVGKITGMLLEMDNKDLMTLLGDKDLLRDRVREANNVLQHATAKGT